MPTGHRRACLRPARDGLVIGGLDSAPRLLGRLRLTVCASRAALGLAVGFASAFLARLAARRPTGGRVGDDRSHQRRRLRRQHSADTDCMRQFGASQSQATNGTDVRIKREKGAKKCTSSPSSVGRTADGLASPPAFFRLLSFVSLGKAVSYVISSLPL
eukprot:6186276-Pleurochrysis_carterae.AAC.6